MTNLFNYNTQEDIRVEASNSPLRISFQGSKQAIVKKLYYAIKEDLQNNCTINKINTIYDVFCGGGSVAYFFYQNGYKVIANDINTNLIALHKQLQIGIDKELLYKWISREEFLEIIKQDGWYSELVKICWSFGNNKKGYLYGKDIEDYKKQLHFVVVNKCEQSAKRFLEMIGKEDDYENFSKIFDIKLQQKRRLFIRNYVLKNTINKKFGKHNDKYLYCDIQDYDKIKALSIVEKANWLNKNYSKTTLTSLERLESTVQLEQLEQLQQLQQLERLEQLERLAQQNKNLQFFNQNYWEFEFDNNSIIYCDPPYLNTRGYDKNEFDFEKFDNWVREMKNKGIRVYISEYTNHNDEWREVVSIDKIALACNKTLSGTKKTKQEKLFCNI